MKNPSTYISVFAVSLFLLFSFKIDDYKPFELSLKTGNATALSDFFEEQVELTIQGGEFNIQNNYSKVQARNILVNFFKKNTVKNFETKHSGQSNWSKYIIGYLETEHGKYRTLVRYLSKDNILKIQELELTLEDGE